VTGARHTDSCSCDTPIRPLLLLSTITSSSAIVAEGGRRQGTARQARWPCSISPCPCRGCPLVGRGQVARLLFPSFSFFFLFLFSFFFLSTFYNPTNASPLPFVSRFYLSLSLSLSHSPTHPLSLRNLLPHRPLLRALQFPSCTGLDHPTGLQKSSFPRTRFYLFFFICFPPHLVSRYKMAMAAGYPQSPPRSTSPRQQQQPSQITFGTFAHHVMSLLENGKSQNCSLDMWCPRTFKNNILTRFFSLSTLFFHPLSLSISLYPLLPGKTFTFTTTTKRRISKNMISEPKNFEHLIHTETEAEATQIFKDWIRNPSAGKLPGEFEETGRKGGKKNI